MRRRDLMAMLGGMAVAWPRATSAQSAGWLPLIGVLVPTLESDPEMSMLSQELLRELQGLGWTRDRNRRIAYRWGAGDEDRIYAYAAELIALAPNVILAAGAPAVAPLRRLTSTLPIVFISVSDPVGQGFVTSLAHPGGNITGFSNFDPTTGGTWLRLLTEIAPQTKRVAVLTTGGPRLMRRRSSGRSKTCRLPEGQDHRRPRARRCRARSRPWRVRQGAG